MGVLDGRVVVVTGAGRGLGREHARLLAAEGARLVVNDLGCAADGSGTDPAVIATVTDELRAAGADVVSTVDDVATLDGARRLLDTALEAYGEVHGLVNNAGILRDRMLVNMAEDEWDGVIRGQLRGTFGPTRVFAAHWRAVGGSGAAIVNVSSTSGLIGQVGQTNYGAAKAGIAALTVILAEEVRRYGIRVNGIVPVARTRMTENVPGVAEVIAAPADPSAFDVYHPGNVSPLVGWLVSAGCPVTGQLYYAKGGEIRHMVGWQYGKVVDRGSRWTVAEIDEAFR